MKLLICTQIVDPTDSTLGFFHKWIEELAPNYESIVVICLQKGQYKLPANVRVFSLGKERIKIAPNIIQKLVIRLLYVINFYRYIYKLRGEYDACFVHMNQEYILLGAPFWKILRKPVYMWRNHYAGSFFTTLAIKWSKKVFCTSKYSYTAKFEKNVLMPVGVDVDTTSESFISVRRISNSILSIGRISPSKKLDLIIEALGCLHKKNIVFTADIIGNALPEHVVYRNRLIERTKELDIEKKVQFLPALPKTQTYAAYLSHEIFINASPSGMLDKTNFSAMAYKCLILSSSLDISELVPEIFIFSEGDINALADKLEYLLNLSPKEKNKFADELQNLALKKHSLSVLIKKLKAEIQI